MVSYLYDAPAGVVGSITRVDLSAVEPGMLDATTPPTAFGQPVKINAATGKFQLMGTAAVAADFQGIITRITPAISGSLDETFAGGVPKTDQFQSIMTRGYCSVTCGVGTPARDGAVYVRVVDGGVGKPVGQFEATADGANNVLLANVVWASNGKDSTNIAEVRVAR
jgi:hypothetical protein